MHDLEEEYLRTGKRGTISSRAIGLQTKYLVAAASNMRASNERIIPARFHPVGEHSVPNCAAPLRWRLSRSSQDFVLCRTRANPELPDPRFVNALGAAV